MIMKLVCKVCGRRRTADLDDVNARLEIVCFGCLSVLSYTVVDEEQVLLGVRGKHGDPSLVPENPVTESPPEIPVGSEIRIENRDHVLHGRTGVVVSKKHVHYRVDLDGLVVTVPELWVRYVG